VFNALRLSVKVLAEVLAAEVLAAEILGEVLADVVVVIAMGVVVAAEAVTEVAGGTELKARVKIQQLEELKVLLVAVYY
jgi:hypothetical protein